MEPHTELTSMGRRKGLMVQSVVLISIKPPGVTTRGIGMSTTNSVMFDCDDSKIRVLSNFLLCFKTPAGFTVTIGTLEGLHPSDLKLFVKLYPIHWIRWI